MQHFRPLLAEHGLTEQQWRVLRALSAEADPIDVGALVEITSLLAPSLTRILAKLADHGHIDRNTAPDDQRRSVISLSASGSKLVAKIAPQSEATYALIESRFGKTRLHSLITELHELTAAITDEDKPR